MGPVMTSLVLFGPVKNVDYAGPTETGLAHLALALHIEPGRPAQLWLALLSNIHTNTILLLFIGNLHN